MVIMVPHVTSLVLFNQLLPYSYPRVRVAFRYDHGWQTPRRFHTPPAGLQNILRSNCKQTDMPCIEIVQTVAWPEDHVCLAMLRTRHFCRTFVTLPIRAFLFTLCPFGGVAV